QSETEAALTTRVDFRLAVLQVGIQNTNSPPTPVPTVASLTCFPVDRDRSPKRLKQGRSPLCKVKQKDFGGNAALNRNDVHFGEGNAIPSGKLITEEIHTPPKNLKPHCAARLDFVSHLLSRNQRSQIQPGVLVNGEGAIVPVRRGDQAEAAILWLHANE